MGKKSIKLIPFFVILLHYRGAGDSVPLLVNSEGGHGADLGFSESACNPYASVVAPWFALFESGNFWPLLFVYGVWIIATVLIWIGHALRGID